MSLTPRTKPWQGTLLLDAGCVLYIGPAGDTKPHRHHALQLCVALDAPFAASIDPERPDEPLANHEGLLIDANVEHRVDGRGALLGLYYVEASSREGRALKAVLRGRSALALSPRSVHSLRSAFAAVGGDRGSAVLATLRGRVSEALDVSTPEVRALEPRIDRALQLLDATLPGPVRVAELARTLGLPQRQLSALFKEETGLSVSTYVLWRRLRTAVSAVAAGASLTEAAYAAGFADAAHLSRTFVRMFGVTPSSSVASSEVVEAGE